MFIARALVLIIINVCTYEMPLVIYDILIPATPASLLPFYS